MHYLPPNQLYQNLTDPHLDISDNENDDDDENIIPDTDCILDNNDTILNLVAKIPTLLAKFSAMKKRNNELGATCLDTSQQCSRLMIECASLKTELTAVKTELTAVKAELNEHKSAIDVRTNRLDQHGRSNSILIHNLPNVPHDDHGKKFSMYVKQQLKRHFPSINVSLYDIDVSHILYYASPPRQNPFVICRFVNRDLRKMYMDFSLSNSYTGNVFFSDHLSPRNIELFEKAVKATNSDSVWFSKRQVHAIVNGNVRIIEKESDLNVNSPSPP